MLYDKRWDDIKVQFESWRVLLLRAAELIEIRGWCQRQTVDKHGGICTLGAIDTAARQLNFEWIIESAARKALEAVIGSSIPEWNDSPGRTKAMVVMVLRRAANG